MIYITTVCDVNLVSGKYGVPDGGLTAISSYNKHMLPRGARLDTEYDAKDIQGSWGAGGGHLTNSWIQVVVYTIYD